MTSSLLLVFVCLRLSLAQDEHFLGGSISFKFTEFSQAPYKVKFTVLTGWTLGQGPCGSTCNYADIGRSVDNTYKTMLRYHGKTYFGSWFITERKHLVNDTYTDITDYIISNTTGHVVGVNSPVLWEQDLNEVFCDVNPKGGNTEIKLAGKYWRQPEYTNKQATPVKYYLHATVNPHIRNDTGQPNRSPVASFKPVYRLPLNSRNTIKLSIMDEDDDFIKCRKSSFVELGFLLNMPNNKVNITRDCNIEINTFKSDGFKNGGWGTVAITVFDLPRHDVSVGNNMYTSNNGIPYSTILVKFMVQTVLKVDAPAFVAPTRETRHEFIVFVGAAFTQQLYAEPSSVAIQSFFVRSIPHRIFTITDPHADPTRLSTGVKYTTLAWRPGVEDVGKYLVTASVVDTEWNDGDNRDFVVTIKGNVYFPFLPENHSITCLQGSTCIVPVYSRSKAGYTIENVNTTFTSISDIEISTPLKLVKNGLEVYETDVSITPAQGGDGRVCIEATDDAGSHSGKVCLNVKTKFQDPCRSEPCHHYGICTSNDTMFTCKCRSGTTGDLCETSINYCDSNPCHNNGTCVSVLNRGLAICVCNQGYTGSHCEFELCTNGSCLNAGVCEESTHMCQCPVGYTGSLCEA